MKYEESLKKVRNVTLAFAAAYLVLGVAMIAAQEQFRELLGYALGAAAVLYGVFRLVRYFRHHKEDLIAMDLFYGLFFLAGGACSFFYHGKVMNYLVVIFGVLLFIGALIKFQNAIDLKALEYENWWIVMILGFVSIVFAALLILRPSFVTRIYMTIAGVFMIYDSVSNIAAYVFAHIVFRRVKKGLSPNRIPKEKKQEASATDDEDVPPTAEYEPVAAAPQYGAPNTAPGQTAPQYGAPNAVPEQAVPQYDAADTAPQQFTAETQNTDPEFEADAAEAAADPAQPEAEAAEAE
ncbi:MAG: DUF308 domain-containing protein [Lachnospiraceae bacterium]|nr:DUF308 domain-containing protein [Lachnospiraceae bacterium]